MKFNIILQILLLFFVNRAFSQKDLNHIDENGLKQGKWIEYYPDTEILKKVMEYSNDTLNGDTKIYYESGILRSEIVYLSGTKIYQISYHKNMEKSMSVLYDNKGNLKYMCKYDEKGRIRMQEMYFIDEEGRECNYSIFFSDDCIPSEGTLLWR